VKCFNEYHRFVLLTIVLSQTFFSDFIYFLASAIIVKDICQSQILSFRLLFFIINICCSFISIPHDARETIFVRVNILKNRIHENIPCGHWSLFFSSYSLKFHHLFYTIALQPRMSVVNECAWVWMYSYKWIWVCAIDEGIAKIKKTKK
jgi:hypothetical protein